MKFSFSALLLLSIACFPTLVFSQITTANGFIITEAGEKQVGSLEYVNATISTKRLFFPEGSQEIIVLRPDMVQSFQINPDVNFKTLLFKGKKVFMQVVSEGQLNLYKYKGELFVKTPSDSLLHLTGGRKTEMKDGKKYAVVDYTYKKQLEQALNNPTLDHRLNNLEFDRKPISRLAKEINGQPENHPEPTLQDKHQFELNFSYTRNAVTLKNIDFREDSISFGETFEEEADIEYLPGEKQKIDGFGLGLFYKLKVGRKYSYLKAGLVYNHAPEVQKTQHYNFFAWRNVDHPDNWQHIGNGNSRDTYTYKLSTLEIPVSYHADLTDGKLRPFIELGLVSRLYNLASVTLKREITTADGVSRVQTDAMELPPVTVGPMIAFGYKYLLSANSSVMAGFNANATTSFEHRPTHNLHRNSNLNVFVAYGF